MKIEVELEPNQAAALFRLCEKLGYNDAQCFLYPHLPHLVRGDQVSHMLCGARRVLEALKEAGVHSAWPWIETGNVP